MTTISTNDKQLSTGAAPPPPLESWRLVWREGFAPHFTEQGLRALLRALEEDDPRLRQGCTTTPPPLMCVQDWPCEGACPVSYGAVGGIADRTVGEVEEAFAKACFEADAKLGEPAACRWLLNWVDDTPRNEMRAELAAEVRAALAARTSAATEV